MCWSWVATVGPLGYLLSGGMLFGKSKFPSENYLCWKASLDMKQTKLTWWWLQYLAHLIRPGKHIFDRFAVLFTVAIVWIYAYILTVAGAYNGKPQRTQISCRTDRAGLIGAAPWYIIFFYHFPGDILVAFSFITSRHNEESLSTLIAINFRTQ